MLTSAYTFSTHALVLQVVATVLSMDSSAHLRTPVLAAFGLVPFGDSGYSPTVKCDISSPGNVTPMEMGSLP